MPVEVIMPQMGESIAEGTLVRWLKKEGDRVARDEPLFEISTDKVDTEIPSPADGVLKEIKVQEGQTVAVQTVVALLAAESEAEAPGAPAAGATTAGAAAGGRRPQEAERSGGEAARREKPAAREPRSPRQGDGSRVPAAEEAGAAAAGAAAASPAERLRQRSSPLVRRIAREHGIAIERLRGTGAGGRVTKQDILAVIEGAETGAGASPAAALAVEESAPGREPQIAAAAEHSPPLPDFAAGDVLVEPMTIMRQKIAEHMVLSKRTSAHVTTVFEIDMTEVARKIAESRDAFLRSTGVKLTYLPFILKAVIGGLREHPMLNAAISGKEIHYFKKINLGIAVALDDGLIVPVVQDADEKSMVGLARAVKDLAERARAKKLRPEEVRGGTFTISNHGVFGSLFATPVISQPQVGILGVGAVTKRPVVLPGTDSIAIRSMMYLALSFDHRLIDGAVADKFLAKVKELLERCPFSPQES